MVPEVERMARTRDLPGRASGVGIPLTALGYTARPMSKVCAVCGKKPGFGNNRSHSMVATKRRFNPNLQRVRVLLKGKATRAYVCTRCLKGGKVQKAI
jgi:large subunit ribosomal protein L28